MLTRRQFVQLAVAAGAAAAVPPVFESLRNAAGASSGSGFFLTSSRWATCQALCARIVPTDSSPGATEARAVVFVDRFLAAFDLPSSVADNPPIWVRGRYSGRNPYPGEGGYASNDFPPDAFLSDAGVGNFLGLTAPQEVSWLVQLYGTGASLPSWVNKTWVTQLASLNPPQYPEGLRKLYDDGLDAFDSYSQSTFGTSFANANPEEQDAMLALAGNVILSNVWTNAPLPSPPAVPAAASELVPAITLHTFQATYGIPEYAWLNQMNDPAYVSKLGGTNQWKSLGYDGDTQPLGNSIFDPDMFGPGEGPNEGFGMEGVYVPFGGYREFRPVSTLDPSATPLSDEQAAAIKQAITTAMARNKQ